MLNIEIFYSFELCSRGETLRKIWVGLCGPLPKTLALFMTKICD